MMPDDCEGVDAHVMQGYQSVWMAHWMHTSYKSETLARNHLSIDCKVKEVKEDSDAEKHCLLGGSEIAVDGSVHAGAFGEAARDTRVTFMKEVDPQKSKKTSFDSKSFPIFNVSQKMDGISSLKRERNDVNHGEDQKAKTEASSGDDDVSLIRTLSHLPSTSTHAPPKTENLVRKCQVFSQGILPTALLIKSQYGVERNKLAVSTSLWNDFVKSASDIMPNGCDKGKPPSTCGQHEIYQPCYKLASQQHFTNTKYHSYSSLLIRERKMSDLLDPQRSSFSRWIQGGIAHLPHNPIAGSGDGVYFVRGQRHDIKNYTDNANITNQTASLESTKPQNFYGPSSLAVQVPCSMHDIKETMKIYTSTDSVEESSRGHPKTSQTTHCFLLSRKGDVNLSDRGQFFRESIAPAKFGNAFDEILDFFPPTSDHALEGVKLEALEASKKSEGKEDVQNLKSRTSLKNESSAETDTMDINALHENCLAGDVPLQTSKCTKDSQNSSMSQVAITSARDKTKAKSVNAALLDTNQDSPELLTLASPVADRETSTSRTHSLDMEHLLSHADEHARSKSGNSSLGPDPSNRWVKRLKLCSLGSALGTKSATIGETSSHEKVNNIFSKVMTGSKTNLEPKMGYHAEEQMVPDLPATVLTNGKSSFTEVKKTVEITLSHPWIQRWSHNRAVSSQKRHELVKLREPKSSNSVLEEFQKKQFPSIAAMALMGKAMNSLNPSELVRKGPVVVWNTKGF